MALRGIFVGIRAFNKNPEDTEANDKMGTARAQQIARAVTEVPLQPASLDIWDKKYRLKTKQGEPVDATVDDTWSRVARALADVETTPELRERWHERFLWALRHGAIPAGRITSNAGAREHKPATSTIKSAASRSIGAHHSWG